MPRRALLDYALLGLLATERQSGYDLRKTFQETPLGHYSDSPGSIYPALARLEGAQEIRRTATRSARRRSTLAITAAGKKRLLEWLDEPLDAAGVSGMRGELELKLAFYSDHRSDEQLRRFLVQVADAFAELHRRAGQAREMLGGALSPSGTIALSLGVHLLEAKAAFLREAARHPFPKAVLP